MHHDVSSSLTAGDGENLFDNFLIGKLRHFLNQFKGRADSKTALHKRIHQLKPAQVARIGPSKAGNNVSNQPLKHG